jgi:hypothetical protein
MPPLTCPPPEPVAPDCPLYDQRVPYADDESLRRLILTERRRYAPGLAAQIRAEAMAARPPEPYVRRPVAALPPAPEPQTLPIFVRQKGATT